MGTNTFTFKIRYCPLIDLNNKNHLLSEALSSGFAARVCQPTAGLASTCPQTEVIDSLSSLVGICDQNVEFLYRCWLLDPDYHYKSVAIRFPHSAGLAPIP